VAGGAGVAVTAGASEPVGDGPAGVAVAAAPQAVTTMSATMIAAAGRKAARTRRDRE
jgi:hypothetical protein